MYTSFREACSSLKYDVNGIHKDLVFRPCQWNIATKEYESYDGVSWTRRTVYMQNQPLLDSGGAVIEVGERIGAIFAGEGQRGAYSSAVS